MKKHPIQSLVSWQAEQIKALSAALRREVLMRHSESHAPFGLGSDFMLCPNLECREVAQLISAAQKGAQIVKHIEKCQKENPTQ